MSNRQRQRRIRRRRAAVIGGTLGGSLAISLSVVSVAEAATFEVTNHSDSEATAGSLPYEIEAANRARGTNVITFSSKVTGSIDLSVPLPKVTDSNLTLEGPGARKLTLNASKVGPSQYGVLYGEDSNSGSSLTISGLSLDDSQHQPFGFVYARSAKMVLRDDTFSHDSADEGGGASTYGPLTVDGCTFTDDSASSGGALYVGDTTLNVYDSTFTNNTATVTGGAVRLWDTTATFVDSTISGNVTSYTAQGKDDPYGYGGGIYTLQDHFRSGSLSLEDTIVSGDSDTGDSSLSGYAARAAAYRDIFSTGEFDGTPAPFSASFSLIQDPGPLTGLAPTDITGEGADLGPLANNGGPTDTELPLPGSPVINAGRAFGLKTDQRGLPRAVDYPGVAEASGGDRTDIGAAELQPFITGLSSSRGKAGKQITIEGSGLSIASTVYFGRTKAKFKRLKDGDLKVTVPKGKHTVNVSVRTSLGQARSATPLKFKYSS